MTATQSTETAHELLRPSALAWSVQQGRDVYLAENGFTVESYDFKWTPASLLGINFAVPNTENHRRASMWHDRHDLHDVATGFGTDPAGEGEVSMWDLRRGLRGLDLCVNSVVIAGAMLGLAVAPKRMLRAWKASGEADGDLFSRDITDYDDVLAINIGELRETLGVPAVGIAFERGLHSTAPKRIEAAA